jgi:DNA-binding transcriptional LysR family regulator
VLERHELEAFLALAEELHFGRTAERLHVSTGRISQTIKKLERRVGAPLFDRTSRAVRLTALGRQLDGDLRPAYEQIVAGVRRAVDVGRGVECTLRVGFSTPWLGNFVVTVADAFRVAHPACVVQIQEVQLGDPLGPLRSGDRDIQLSEFPIVEPDITTGPVISSEPRALAVPSKHRLAQRATVTLDDLADAPLVTVSGALPTYWLEHHFPARTPSGRPIPRGPEVSFHQEVLSQVGAGRGVSPTCVRAAQYYARPDVTYVPFSDAPPVEYGLIWRAADDSPTIEAFVRAVSAAARTRFGH